MTYCEYWRTLVNAYLHCRTVSNAGVEPVCLTTVDSLSNTGVEPVCRTVIPFHWFDLWALWREISKIFQMKVLWRVFSRLSEAWRPVPKVPVWIHPSYLPSWLRRWLWWTPGRLPSSSVQYLIRVLPLGSLMGSWSLLDGSQTCWHSSVAL